MTGIMASSDSRPAKPAPRRGDGKAALLDAVVRVTAQQGLRGVTYRSVAQEAGVSYGAVTYHFGNRDAMIEEAIAMTLAQTRQPFPEGRISSIEEIGASLLAASRETRDVQLFQFEIALEATRKPELLPLVNRINQHYEHGLARQLEAIGITDPATQKVLFSALDGLTFLHLTSGDTAEFERSLQAFHALVRGAVDAQARS